MEEQAYQRRGYLREPFRLFHLRDISGWRRWSTTTNEFHKAVFFLAGSAAISSRGGPTFSSRGMYCWWAGT